MRRILCAVFALTLTAGQAPPVEAADASPGSDEQKIVDGARTALEQLRTDNAMGETARDLIHKARAVLIVPPLIKAGFFLGGHGGSGVLLARSGAGWTSPCFYGVGGGSIGLQIGGEVSRLVLIIMSDKALNAAMNNEFKVGAAADITVVTIGAGGEAATTANAGADIYDVAVSKGFYGGVALEGAIMSPRDSWNKTYYRRDVSVQDIVHRNSVSNPGAAALRTALAKF